MDIYLKTQTLVLGGDSRMGNRKSVFLLGSTAVQEITESTMSYLHTTSSSSWCLGLYKVIDTYQSLPTTGRRRRDHLTKLWNIDRRKTSLCNVPGWNFLDGRDLCWLDIIFPIFRFRARWASKKKWQSDATRPPSFLVFFLMRNCDILKIRKHVSSYINQQVEYLIKSPL